jgi:hypothetical protein
MPAFLANLFWLMRRTRQAASTSARRGVGGGVISVCNESALRLPLLTMRQTYPVSRFASSGKRGSTQVGGTKGFPDLYENVCQRVEELHYENLNAFVQAKRLGNWVYALKSGRVPRLPHLERLANALECPWQWLVVGKKGFDVLVSFRKKQETGNRKQETQNACHADQALALPPEGAEDAHQPPASAGDARYFIAPLTIAGASRMPEAARPRFQFRAAHIDPEPVLQWFVAHVNREPLPSDVEPANGTTALRSSIVELNQDEPRRDGGEPTPPPPRGITGYRLLRRRRPRTP